MPSDYDFNVFINCPFDDEYESLFDAILFTVYMCGFRPRCSLEANDAGIPRIKKIKKIIKECRFGIHDISRTDLDQEHGLPRFNMPLELGIFIGAREFGSLKQKSKIIIIFDIEKYRYQKYISDIAGQDINEHKNELKLLIKSLRDSFNSAKIYNKPIAGSNSIIEKYAEFQAKLPTIRRNLSIGKEDNTYADKTKIIERWLKIVQ